MKALVWVLLVVGSVAAVGQTALVDPAEALGKLAFMQGDWAGKQDFNTGGGPAMVGDATDKIATGIAGKYVCEMLSTTLPGASLRTRGISSRLTRRRGSIRLGGLTILRTIRRR